MSETKNHLHRCQNCGTIWGHGDVLVEDVEAHKCPKCGAQQWRKFSGLNSDRENQPTNAITVVTWNYSAYLRAILTVAVIVIGAVLLGTLVAPWLLPED
jgi:predicted RNA-binding Zn-ribbon protein involved in translation (DUF1610 family)